VIAVEIGETLLGRQAGEALLGRQAVEALLEREAVEQLPRDLGEPFHVLQPHPGHPRR
jgi:hypothetical protein